MPEKYQMMQVPPWANCKTACQLFGIGKDRLASLRDEGIIRAKKTGEANSAPHVYRTADIIDWLEGAADADRL